MDLKRKEDIGTGKGGEYPTWNIYMSPPAKNHEAMCMWRKLIWNMVFTTDDYNARKTYKIFMCTTCHLMDHPGGMCPLHKLSTWIVPTPTHLQTLNDLLNPNPQGNS